VKNGSKKPFLDDSAWHRNSFVSGVLSVTPVQSSHTCVYAEILVCYVHNFNSINFHLMIYEHISLLYCAFRYCR